MPRTTAAAVAAFVALVPCVGRSDEAAPESCGLSYGNVSTGAVLDAGIGTSMVGDALMGELGAESAGIKTLRCGRWLLQWDGLLAVKGGVLANEHPYTPLVGGHLQAYVEPGYRFGDGAWAPYVGARLVGDVSLMTEPGYSLGALAKINDLDGVGGVVANGALRVGGGASMLRGPYSLLLVGFFQEAVVAPGYTAPGYAFSDLGISARFDIARKLTLILEGFWGLAPTIAHASLGAQDQAINEGLSLTVRKIFHNSMWLALDVSVSEQADHISYSGSAVSYDTSAAPNWGFTLLYGFPFGPQS